jgi:hypothetical protein
MYLLIIIYRLSIMVITNNKGLKHEKIHNKNLSNNG